MTDFWILIAFWSFFALTIVPAVLVLFVRDIVRIAVLLLFSFSGLAGFYLLLGAEFVAFAQILVYIGGILILLLFGVMLTARDPIYLRRARIRGLVLPGVVTAGVVFLGVATVVFQTEWPERQPEDEMVTARVRYLGTEPVGVAALETSWNPEPGGLLLNSYDLDRVSIHAVFRGGKIYREPFLRRTEPKFEEWEGLKKRLAKKNEGKPVDTETLLAGWTTLAKGKTGHDRLVEEATNAIYPGDELLLVAIRSELKHLVMGPNAPLAPLPDPVPRSGKEEDGHGEEEADVASPGGIDDPAEWVEARPVATVETARTIGDLLMTDYLLPFELASVLLLVALVGAAYIARARDDEEATT